MKYLVHSLGIDAFRGLVESYLGKKIEPWRDMVPWKYSDWMGWHEHGDGNLFLGLNVEQGRVKDEGGVNMKTLLRTLADAPYNLNMMLTPTQSIIIQGIDPSMKQEIEDVVHAHGVKLVEEIDPLTRLSIACPALPMCGLAINEAERVMPTYVERMRALLDKLDLGSEEIMMRITGCPNGCARPYMAELAFVGDGPKSYVLSQPIEVITWPLLLSPYLVFFFSCRKPLLTGTRFGWVALRCSRVVPASRLLTASRWIPGKIRWSHSSRRSRQSVAVPLNFLETTAIAWERALF